MPCMRGAVRVRLLAHVRGAVHELHRHVEEPVAAQLAPISTIKRLFLLLERPLKAYLKAYVLYKRHTSFIKCYFSYEKVFRKPI